MTTLAPLATGYMAPIHGRGAMGFLLLGILSLLTALAGALSVSLPILLIGAAGLVVAAAGFALYARVMATKPLLLVFEDRLEFVRGPQKGTPSLTPSRPGGPASAATARRKTGCRSAP